MSLRRIFGLGTAHLSNSHPGLSSKLTTSVCAALPQSELSTYILLHLPHLLCLLAYDQNLNMSTTQVPYCKLSSISHTTCQNSTSHRSSKYFNPYLENAVALSAQYQAICSHLSRIRSTEKTASNILDSWNPRNPQRAAGMDVGMDPTGKTRRRSSRRPGPEGSRGRTEKFSR